MCYIRIPQCIFILRRSRTRWNFLIHENLLCLWFNCVSNVLGLQASNWTWLKCTVQNKMSSHENKKLNWIRNANITLNWLMTRAVFLGWGKIHSQRCSKRTKRPNIWKLSKFTAGCDLQKLFSVFSTPMTECFFYQPMLNNTRKWRFTRVLK